MADDRPRLGLFGGTFDPPHLGHVVAARQIADALLLDRVIWIPAARSPFKSDDEGTPADVRLRMVRAAVRGEPRFEVWSGEIERGGLSWTIDTVRAVRAEHPDAHLHLVIGPDQARAFGGWREPEALLREATVVVVNRTGSSAPPRDEIPAGARAVSIDALDVTSTGVRARVRAGEAVDDLVPAGVAEIVREEGLYRG